MRENVHFTTSNCNDKVVHEGSSCTINTILSPGVLSEFTDAISPGCPNSSTNSPCGFTLAHQQWQYCPSSGSPQSMGTIGTVNAQNTLILVNGSVVFIFGTVS